MKLVIDRLRNVVSYTEVQGIKAIVNGIDGQEGIVVASKLADAAGVTRSSIVNGLKMLEVAGVIETRSLGMKGIYIKVLDRETLNELIA